MTALVLHGIVHASTPASPAAPTHRQILAGRLCGIATVVRPGAFEKDDPSTLNDVRLHHELLTAYAATSDLLPVRFGAFFSDEAALLDALQQDEAAHISKLTRLSDCVEYLLKLTSGAEQDGGRAQPDPHQHPQDGRSFLQRKRSVRDDRRNLMAKQAAFASALPSELSGISANAPLKSTAPDVLMSAALLVRRHAVPEMTRSAHALARDATELGLKITLRGPGPCYTFADQTWDAPASTSTLEPASEGAYV